VCYLFISGSCEGNCGKLHKDKSDLSNDELEGYIKWETRKNKKSKPKKKLMYHGLGLVFILLQTNVIKEKIVGGNTKTKIIILKKK